MKRPKNTSRIIGFPPSHIEDRNGRYLNIDLSKYPFESNIIYYYFEGGHIFKITNNKFYEIELICSAFNLSFNKKNIKDFGFVGENKKQSISFIDYNNNLYILNTFPITNITYKSLHDLEKN